MRDYNIEKLEISVAMYSLIYNWYIQMPMCAINDYKLVWKLRNVLVENMMFDCY